MTTKQNLTQIKSQLQKIAQDIVDTPNEAAANGINGNGNGAQSPEQVMELVDDAIEILEVAQEAIPAETPAEEPEVTPSIGARKRKARENGEKTEDLNPQDDDPEKEKNARKVRKAQDQETSENDERLDEEDTPEEDIEKKELNARIKTLEAELDKTKKAELAQEFAELYPESVQQSKYDEIANSKESIASLKRDYKVAKELVTVKRESKNYTPPGNQSGYLSRLKKASRETLPAWKV